jgi:ABC-type multidrug transport system fused ATPase/permease subunit
VIIISLPPSGKLMMRWMQLYAAQAPVKDARVKRINEILQSIRVIKLFVWESNFLRLLTEVREKELELIKAQQVLNVASTLMWQSTPVFISLVAFLTLGLTSSNFSPAGVFAALALFNVLRMPLVMLPVAVAQGAGAAVALKRVQDFLLAEELAWAPEMLQPGELFAKDAAATDAPINAGDADAGEKKKSELAVRIESATFEWDATPPAEKEKPKEGADAKADKHKDNKNDGKAAAGQEEKKSDDEPKKDGGLLAALSAAPVVPAEPGFKLENIDLSIKRGSLVCVVGTVGQ